MCMSETTLLITVDFLFLVLAPRLVVVQYQIEELKEQLKAARAQADEADEGAKTQLHDLRSRAQQAEHRLHEVRRGKVASGRSMEEGRKKTS
jgi:hypothetical protein